LGGAITLLSPAAWDGILQIFSPFSNGARQSQGGQKLHKLASTLRARSEGDLYQKVSSVSPDPSELLAKEYKSLSSGQSANPPRTGSNFLEEMMYLDTVTYLPDDILVKVDRASMGASLETRAPFLDHDIIEFAWSLPLSMKIRGGEGKYVLRKVLEKFVPPAITDRPKSGFAIPIGAWLRKELRGWAESALDSTKMRNQGFLDVAAVQKKWQEHLSGKRDWESQLWTVLTLQSWLERQAWDIKSVCASEAQG
jgi:asparagine synthase (glutamine-hydrolysing)